MDMWAGGITEDLIDRLSRLRWIPVIAMASTGDAGVSELTSSAVGALVGASYVVRGQLTTRDDGLDLQVSLFDAKRTQLLWSVRRPLEGGVTHAALGALAQGIVANLDAYVDTAEQALVIKPRRRRSRHRRDGLARALASRPPHPRGRRDRRRSAPALAAGEAELRGGADPVGARQGMVDLVQAGAPGRDRGYAGARPSRGCGRRIRRARLPPHGDGRDVAAQPRPRPEPVRRCDPAESQPSVRIRAVRQQPLSGGAPGRGFRSAGDGIAPEPPGRAGVLRPRGDGDLALHARRARAGSRVHRNCRWHAGPAYSFAHVIRINCLVAAGRRDEARRALADLMRARPQFVATELEWLPFADRHWIEGLKRGLDAAGEPVS